MSGALPACATSPFDSDSLTLRETFEQDGFRYALAGYGTVQLVAISGSGVVEIPESVIFGEAEYRVIAIGGIDADGVYNGKSVLGDGVTAVSIPSSVKYIWYMALSSKKLTEATIVGGEDGIIIADSAFYGSSKLMTVNISGNIKYIGDGAFGNCTTLKKVNFDGTKAQWNAIDIDTSWKSGSWMCRVYCTDGNIR